MKNAIVLCSGGIDSVTTSYYIKSLKRYKKLIVLFFNYKQRSLIPEKNFSKCCAKKINGKFMEVRLDFINKISSSLINIKGQVNKINNLRDTKKESNKFYVPCRNTLFLTYALALAESMFIKKKEIYDIFVGFKCEGRESYPDTTKKFVKKMNQLSRISCTYPFKIIAPFIKKDKEDIIKIGKNLDIDFNKTFSCYIGKNKHCGYCLACKLRQAGFYWAGIEDPTRYSFRN